MRVSMTINSLHFDDCETISRVNGVAPFCRGIEVGLIDFFDNIVMSPDENLLSSLFISDEIKQRILNGESISDIANSLPEIKSKRVARARKKENDKNQKSIYNAVENIETSQEKSMGVEKNVSNVSTNNSPIHTDEILINEQPTSQLYFYEDDDEERSPF